MVLHALTRHPGATLLALRLQIELVYDPGCPNVERARDVLAGACRRAEIPAANGHGNARSVARVAGAVADRGSPLLSEATLAKAIEEQHYATDLVLGVPIRWGLGFGLTSKDLPLGPNPRTFFWGGWGGSLVVIDPDAQLGFAYVMNKMSQNALGDTRAFAPLAALYASL